MEPNVYVTTQNAVSVRQVVNALLIGLVVIVAVALAWRWARRTFQTVYQPPGGCTQDDNYAYKDPEIHGPLGDCY